MQRSDTYIWIPQTLTLQKEEIKSFFKGHSHPQCSWMDSLVSLQTSQWTWEAPNLQLQQPMGTRDTITPGRSGTRKELEHSPTVYPGALNPSSQLLCLACLTTHTEPVSLGLRGETSHTGQSKCLKTAAGWGLFCYYYFGTEVLQQPFWHRKKVPLRKQCTQKGLHN